MTDTSPEGAKWKSSRIGITYGLILDIPPFQGLYHMIKMSAYPEALKGQNRNPQEYDGTNFYSFNKALKGRNILAQAEGLGT